MFHDCKNSILDYAHQDLNDILRKCRMEMPPDFSHEVAQLIRDLFDPRPDRLLKKPPADFGDNYHGGFNIMPSTNPTQHMTDTLVTFCCGGDNLLNRLVDMLFVAGRHDFRKIFFITSKWDESVFSSSNSARYSNLLELKDSGTRIVFILWSIGGLSRIFHL